jgi:hypothetical protein
MTKFHQVSGLPPRCHFSIASDRTNTHSAFLNFLTVGFYPVNQFDGTQHSGAQHWDCLPSVVTRYVGDCSIYGMIVQLIRFKINTIFNRITRPTIRVRNPPTTR